MNLLSLGTADIGSLIVLTALSATSLLSGAIFLYKYMVFYRVQRNLKKALLFRDRYSEVSLQQQIDSESVISLLTELFILKKNAQKNIACATQRSEILLDIFVGSHEEYIPLLSYGASVAPLLGLLGTIWGLMNSFSAIGEQQSIDLATIAPGIAEALVTTLVGLLVAIPTLALFYFFSSWLAKIERYALQCIDVIVYREEDDAA